MKGQILKIGLVVINGVRELAGIEERCRGF